MGVGDEVGVADKVASCGVGDELHGEILYLIIIGLGGEVSVTADKGIGPGLYFF